MIVQRITSSQSSIPLEPLGAYEFLQGSLWKIKVDFNIVAPPAFRSELRWYLYLHLEFYVRFY